MYLSLLFNFIVSFTISDQLLVDLAPKPKISLIPNAENFVENKTTSFACYIENSPADATVVWFIRHKISRVKTFFTYNISRVTSEFRLEKGKSIFPLVMRRDYNDMEIVCRSAACHEDAFLVPKITETIPIDGIRFPYSHQVRGKRLYLRCDVKAMPGIVKELYMRVPRGLVRTKSILQLGKNWTRYAPRMKSQKVKMKVHNGLPIQCFAVTQNYRSDYGNVMSPITTLTVHYLEFLQTSRENTSTSLTLGQSKMVSVRISANPRPSSKQFFVVKVGKTEAETTKLVPRPCKVSVLDVGSYQVDLQFIPRESGMYKILFESPEKIDDIPIFRNFTTAFALKIFTAVFLENESQWNNHSIPKNQLITLTFFLSAGNAPSKDQLQIFVRTDDDIGDTDFAKTGLTKIKEEDENLFRIEMTLYCTQSGFYTPVFRSGDLTIRGPEVHIIVIENKEIRKLLIVVVLLLLLILAILFLLRRCKLKNMVDKAYRMIHVRVATESNVLFPLLRANAKVPIEAILSDEFPDVQMRNVRVMVDGKTVDPSVQRPRDSQLISIHGPERLFLQIVIPTSWKSVKDHELHLQMEMRWGSVIKRLTPLLANEHPISENCIVIMFGRYYRKNGKDRLACRIWEGGEIIHRDEENGKEVKRSQTHRFFWSFLAPSSPFRWPSTHSPLIEMRTNSFFVRLDNEDFALVEQAEVFDQKWVAFIQLIAFEDGGQLRQFVRLVEGQFCQRNLDGMPESNIILNDNDAIFSKHKNVPVDKWKRLFLLLTDNTLIPEWRISRLAEIAIFYRVGITLGIEKGILKVIKGTVNPQVSEWTALVEGENRLQMDFSNCLRGNLSPYSSVNRCL